ncbi:MAG TPA: phosphatidate cytidylyltransferase [Candidatus Acidoferrum sp.]|nr:phosphatidate cytidylyltransferase [Candidatus Acidoferrum sp.]
MTWKRVATALVLIPVVVGLVLFASTAVVAVATAVITVLALWEYFALGEAIGHRAYRVWTIICAMGIVFVQWSVAHPRYLAAAAMEGDSEGIVQSVLREFARFSMVYSTSNVFFLFVLGLMAAILWTKRPLVEALPAAGISSSAILLVAFPLSYAVAIRGIPGYGPELLLFALVITWAGDTTAYFVGRAIGKHPLAPHLSPKKSWEGSVGSMVGSLLVAWAFHYWIRIPIGHLVAMAVIGNVAGQMGDLLESAYKRSAGVKDSGGLLPGHGGVLDRIDALILCIPVIWYYLVLVNPG